MTMIYLVEGSWSDHEAQGYWAARAFTTPEAAEQYQLQCQQYCDQYCVDFWDAFVEKFGAPAAGRDACAFFEVEPYDAEDKQYPGVELANAWFGSHAGCCPADAPGTIKMRTGSPDPRVEMLAGEPCLYRVVEVELING